MASPPRIPILLLGDADIGKSTFLARLHLGGEGVSKPLGPHRALRDLDQPFCFNIQLYNRPYVFEFYDTASPTSYTLLEPRVVLLCFDIGQPQSLKNVQDYWRVLVEEKYNHDDSLPLILLGLCRDIRQKEDYGGQVRALDNDSQDEGTVLRGRSFLYPQEGLKAAQEMRCDRYCECSALTGELCREVFEDIAKTAALTTTEKGAKSPSGCTTM